MDRAAVPRTVSPERMASGEHACLGFDDDTARWEIRAAFAEAGLSRGEQVIFFTDPVTTVEEAVTRLLGQGVHAAVPALRRGQLLVVNQFPADRLAAWRAVGEKALHQGYPGIRATGDMSWCAAPEPALGPAELVSYEAALTSVFADIGFTAICEYDRRLFAPEFLGRVAAAHPVSVLGKTDVLRIERTGPVLRLVGEADLATRADFEYCLKRAFDADAGARTGAYPGQGPPQQLDLTELTFIDAHCAALVVRHAAALGQAGRLLVRCAPLQARTLRLCGAAAVPQLVLEAGASGG
jgi:hypothetical protein